METYVNYQAQGAIATIEFNRPEVLNAYDSGLMRDLVTAFKLACQDKSVNVVVWKGKGRAWCAGANIKFLDKSKKAGRVQDLIQFVALEDESTFAIMNLGKPIIAAIQGYAIGGGCEYAMLADIRIAAEGTRFSFPETGIGGVVTHAGTKTLPHLVGLPKAKELIFTGEMIDAREAARIGLVNKVVPPDELDSAAMEMAERIAKSSPLEVSRMKYALDNGVKWDYETSIKYESDANLLSLIRDIT